MTGSFNSKRNPFISYRGRKIDQTITKFIQMLIKHVQNGKYMSKMSRNVIF